MYILYLDESGNEKDPADKHFVLAGVAVFERQTYHLTQSLDALQSKYFPSTQPIEFHASHIRSGKGFWRKVVESTRTGLLNDIGGTIASAPLPAIALFAAVVEKSDSLYGEDAVKLAAEQVCKRFDTFLVRRYNDASDPQRGLIVFAEGRYHERARVWVNGFRERGTKWGVLNNLSDIPYFASTSETRLLQVADFVSYSVFRLYEEQDSSLFKLIVHRFDQKDGTLHGLAHIGNKHSACRCPACRSRTNPGNFGPWVS
ncbi:MAG: DUF3800 domain-containing protein [Chloroflexi bacterium]|nr:DUF3800 domain-containing protein [Chloroflexota bacterium]